MNDTNSISPHWHEARSSLLTDIPGWFESQETEPLTLSLPDEDWLLEITPDGRLVCVAGYDLDDMKSMLSEGTPEDLGSDELAKQVKFFLQQTTSKYRRKLLAEGFTERMEMNPTSWTSGTSVGETVLKTCMVKRFMSSLLVNS